MNAGGPPDRAGSGLPGAAGSGTTASETSASEITASEITAPEITAPEITAPDVAEAVPSPAAASGIVGAGPASELVRHVSVVNLANVLTVLRLALVPVFVLLIMTDGGHSPGWRRAAFAAYAVAAFTDQFDGYVARRRDTVTDFGILVDPIADKALTMTALVCLSVLGDLSWVVTVVLAIRELGVTLLRLWVIRHGVIAASRGGKIKTLLLNSAIGLYVLPLSGAWALTREVILIAGVVVAVATGLDYVGRALALRRRPGREPSAPVPRE
jgi:CDP-diacylglycerol---glycerol-3-phosphate 3-phosphatidyltransferase